MMRAVAAVVVIAMVFLAGCGGCSDDVIASKPSRDGSVTASLFVRNCGATTDFSTIVSIHASDSGSDDGDIVFVAKGRGGVDLSWSGDRVLQVRCRGCNDQNVFRKVDKLRDVDIVYKN